MNAMPPRRRPRPVDDPTRYAAVERTKLADRAYATLLRKIVTGEVPEGGALPAEAALCRLLGISRPVLRAALLRLRAEDLIESRRGAGSFVKARTPEDGTRVAERRRRMLDDLEFRCAIEPRAAFLAAQRRSEADVATIRAVVQEYRIVTMENGEVGDHLDFRFHLAVAEAAGNHAFVSAIRLVEYAIDHGVNLVRYLVRFDHLERSRSVHADHSEVLHLIEQGLAERAEAAMAAHLDNARARMLRNAAS